MTTLRGWRTRIGTLSLGLLLAACSDSDGASDSVTKQGEETPQGEMPAAGAGGAPSAATVVAELRSRVARETSKAQEAVPAAQAQQDFAFRFLQKLPGDENVAFSPHSLSVSFAMLTDAAAGETLAEIQQAFGFPDIDEAFQRSQNALLQGLAERNHDARDLGNRRVDAQQLAQSSDVWLRPDAPPQDGFLDTLARYYGSGIHQADFAAHPEEVRMAINEKVKTDTHDLIPELMPAESLTQDTVVVLTSALYFKAPWAAPFPRATTGDFHGLDGKTLSTPMLHQETSLPYYAGSRFVSVALPYAGNELSMVLLVPDDGAFDEVRAALTGDTLVDVVASSAPTRVDLSLPKFQLASRIAVKETLIKLGIGAAFERAEASFPKLQSPKVEQVFLDDVQHQATVAIDEEGTEASAATAIQGAGGGSAAPTADPVVVNVDHPFFFVIRDNPTGAVLFVGQVVNP